MGFFKKIFSDSKDYAKIANAVANVKALLDESELNLDVENYLIVAWICRIGIIDVIEKNNWPMTYKLFVPINGYHTRMTLHEAFLMSVGRVSIKIGTLSDDKVKDAIQNILEKGEWFYRIDSQIPNEKRRLFQ